MTVIDNLQQQLADYHARFLQESSVVNCFKDFLNQYQLASFDRATIAGHITASCFLLNTTKTHVLLTHHKKLNLWIQPGGHADNETNLHTVVLQEANEESGIEDIELLLGGEIFDIDRHIIPAIANDPAHYHYDFRFALHAVESDDYIVSDESHDLKWVALSQLKTIASDESVLRMGDKWLALN